MKNDDIEIVTLIIGGVPVKRYKRPCKFCGKETFVVRPQYVYCSDECSKKARAERDLEKTVRNRERYSKIVVACKECGKEFLRGARGKKFCSDECSRKYTYRMNRATEHPMGEILVCANCGKEFARTANKQRFCCEACKEESYKSKEPVKDSKEKRLLLEAFIAENGYYKKPTHKTEVIHPDGHKFVRVSSSAGYYV